MTTQTETRSQDLLEETRRILTGATQPRAPAAASPCCSAEKQEVCCDPSEKSACCGVEATSGGGCGCP